MDLEVGGAGRLLYTSLGLLVALVVGIGIANTGSDAKKIAEEKTAIQPEARAQIKSEAKSALPEVTYNDLLEWSMARKRGY